MYRVPSLRVRIVFALLVFGPGVGATSFDSDLVGRETADVIESFGAPVRMFTEPTATRTDVFIVFLYEDYTYVYFFNNEVWQLRVDERSQTSLHGVNIGDTIESVAFELGPPRWEPDTMASATFPLRDHDYELELRVFVDSGGRVHDIYLYRADF